MPLNVGACMWFKRSKRDMLKSHGLQIGLEYIKDCSNLGRLVKGLCNRCKIAKC